MNELESWEAQENRRAYMRDYYRKKKERKSADQVLSYHKDNPDARFNEPQRQHVLADGRSRPSDDLIEDRNRRFSYIPTITEHLCGDPRPGQSALDQKRNGVTR